MKIVTINRATWSAGKHNTGSASDDAPTNALLTDRGQRCCLGFACKVSGYSDKQMLGVGMPSDLNSKRYPAALLQPSPHTTEYGHSISWEIILANMNDAPDIDDATREDWIRAGFRIVMKRQVRFIGKYPRRRK